MNMADVLQRLREPATEREKAERVNRFIRILVPEDTVTELRLLGKGKPLSGYFKTNELTEAILRVEAAGYPGIYWTPQTLPGELYQRAPGNFRAGGATTDTDVTEYRYLLVDLDPDRPTKTGSTDDELKETLELAVVIAAELNAEGWPAPLGWGCSGNGVHLYFSMSLPAELASLVSQALQTLSTRYSTDRIKVDTTVYNPARIFRVPGTTNRKGEATEDRPHRQACLFPPEWLGVSEQARDVLSKEFLEGFVAQHGAAPEPSKPARKQNKKQTRNSLGERWADLIRQETRVKVSAPKPWNGGWKYVMEGCPLDTSHEQDRGAVLIEHEDGNVSFKCHHSRCQDKKLGDLARYLRTLFETKKQALPAILRGDEEPWPEPQPLESGGLPVFPLEVFPRWAREYLEAVTESLQTPSDLAGMFFLGALAIAAAKRYDVRVKPDWVEPLVLWILVAALSGEGKSQVYPRVISPLKEWEETAAENFKAIQKAAKKQIKEKTKDLETASKAKGIPSSAAADLEAELDELFVPQTPSLYGTGGSAEGVVKALAEHFGRYAVSSADSDILGMLVGRYSPGLPPIEDLLASFSAEDIKSVFSTKELPHVIDACLTLLCATQPENARDLYSSRKLAGRGAYGRFLVSFPSCTGSRAWTESYIPAETKDAYHRAFQNLLPTHDELVETYCDRQKWSTTHLHFGVDAVSIFREFFERFQRRREKGGDLQFVSEWTAKGCGHCARVAGLLHLADHADSDYIPKIVEGSTVERAVYLMESYLIPHALAAQVEVQACNADKVWSVLLTMGLEVNRREIQQAVRPMATSELDQALQALEDAGRLRVETVDTGRRGRRPQVIRLNPSALEPRPNCPNSRYTKNVVTTGDNLGNAPCSNTAQNKKKDIGESHSLPPDDPQEPHPPEEDDVGNLSGWLKEAI